MLSDVDGAAAQVWLLRERTEHEAAVLFDRLAEDLRESAAPSDLVALARRCAADERNHAELCRRIVEELAPGWAPLTPDRAVRLGPRDASPARRALFASVALGCITETLSTALLIEMRPRARAGAVRDAMEVILRDEVRHSRLGWAHLAYAAALGDVGYLEPALPKMLSTAVSSEVVDSPVTDADRDALCARGVLPRALVRRISEGTVHATIVPGLERYGLSLRRRGEGSPSSRPSSFGRGKGSHVERTSSGRPAMAARRSEPSSTATVSRSPTREAKRRRGSVRVFRAARNRSPA